MNALDRLIPIPRLLELDHVDLAAPPEQVWEVVRHADFARAPLVRALFSIRALPDRLAGRGSGDFTLRIDDLVSTPEKPGFRIFIDDPPREVAIGAIGKVWKPEIPFLHLAGADEFAGFTAPDFAKVAWALRVLPLGQDASRVELEVRVDATDEPAWRKFRRYFRVIGIGSHWIRRVVMASFAKELGTPEALERTRPLPGDELVPDAQAQDTRGVTIAATPEAIWPWLTQMGCGRAGFYSYDLLDNGNQRSARELHPELGALAVGDLIRASPEGSDSFEVLRVEPGRCLILGGLYDPTAGRQLPFAAPRPERFWQVSWAFVLEPLDAGATRLHVRARAGFPARGRLHAAWIRPVHHLMEDAQLRHLAARVEGRARPDDWHDVLAGAGGAAIMAAAFLTSFLRSARSHWGVSAELAAKRFPGDERVESPGWCWTHGIEIDAPVDVVWPWIAQVGADRAGFYSYQWLENLAGCKVRNAERIHPEWQVKVGDQLRLHPKMPPLQVVELSPWRWFLAYGAPDEPARAAGKPWAAVTWLFHVEPLGPRRCRLISRYRCSLGGGLAQRLALGPTLIEPIGFAMDRRMLRGVKAAAERVPRALRRFEPASAPQQPRG